MSERLDLNPEALHHSQQKRWLELRKRTGQVRTTEDPSERNRILGEVVKETEAFEKDPQLPVRFRNALVAERRICSM